MRPAIFFAWNWVNIYSYMFNVVYVLIAKTYKLMDFLRERMPFSVMVSIVIRASSISYIRGLPFQDKPFPAQYNLELYRVPRPCLISFHMEFLW